MIRFLEKKQKLIYKIFISYFVLVGLSANMLVYADQGFSNKDMYGDQYKNRGANEDSMTNGYYKQINEEGAKTQAELSGLDPAKPGENSRLLDPNGNPMTNQTRLATASEEEKTILKKYDQTNDNGEIPPTATELAIINEACMNVLQQMAVQQDDTQKMDFRAKEITSQQQEWSKRINAVGPQICSANAGAINACFINKQITKTSNSNAKMETLTVKDKNGAEVINPNLSDEAKADLNECTALVVEGPNITDKDLNEANDIVTAVIDDVLCGFGISKDLGFFGKWGGDYCKKGGELHSIKFAKENPVETAIGLLTFFIPAGGLALKGAMKLVPALTKASKLAKPINKLKKFTTSGKADKTAKSITDEFSKINGRLSPAESEKILQQAGAKNIPEATKIIREASEDIAKYSSKEDIKIVMKETEQALKNAYETEYQKGYINKAIDKAINDPIKATKAITDRAVVTTVRTQVNTEFNQRHQKALKNGDFNTSSMATTATTHDEATNRLEQIAQEAKDNKPILEEKLKTAKTQKQNEQIAEKQKQVEELLNKQQ